MAEGLSYSTYTFLDYVFPFGLGILVILVQVLLIITAFKTIPNALFLYSKAVFSGVLKKDDNGRSLFYNYYSKSNHYVSVLSFVSTVVLYCVFISFWASFLLKETFVCDRRFDCFAGNSSLSLLFGEDFERVQDCDKIKENATVICFHFVFDSSEGFSYAVGFFGVAVPYIHIYGHLVIWIMEKMFAPNVATLAKFVWCVCLAVVWLAPWIFVIVLASLPALSDLTEYTGESFVKLYAFLVCFAIGGPFLAIFSIIFLRKSIRQKLRSARNEDPRNGQNQGVDPVPEAIQHVDLGIETIAL
jgi:hypothetical protein